MDKKFLNRVVGHIVKETKIDYGQERVYTPFSLFHFLHLSPLPIFFPNHCKNVYGLNEQEIKYVWIEYKDIINDKINKELV